MDLSLVGTDALLEEIEKRATTGMIYLAKLERDDQHKNDDNHRFKTRMWGSPLVQAGIIRAMQLDNDEWIKNAEDIESESW